MVDPTSAAGRPERRQRKTRTTRASVRVVERLARAAITLGGGLTIVAVGTICLFLVWVVVPLFGGARVEAGRRHAEALEARVLQSGVDEYRRLGWYLLGDGTLEVRELERGERIESRNLFDGQAPSAVACDPEDGTAAVGFADGTLRLGSIRFALEFLVEDTVSEAERALAPGAAAVVGNGVVERTREGQLRRLTVEAAFAAPVAVSSAVERIDVTSLPSGPVLATLGADGKLALSKVHKSENLLTGETTVELASCELPYRVEAGNAPLALRILGAGDNVLLLWSDGRAVRFDARDFDKPVEAEVLDLVPEPKAEITALEFLAGKRTLLVGDSLGRVNTWFRIKPHDAGTLDGSRMACGHRFEGGPGPVVALASSGASRLFAAGFGDGSLQLFYATSETELATFRCTDGVAPVEITLGPREDVLLVRTAGGVERFDVDVPHPEASVSALFRPVWYENYEAPAHVWQSSSGTDDFEPKLGLMPLVFGTLKATFYSLLFGVPLALFAAIYSSEFLAPRLRVGVKSTIEIMASLPSVVLGFLSAIVIAPIVQGSLAVVLTAFFTIPSSMLAGAYLWQLLPQGRAVRWQGWPRFVAIGLAIPAGLGLALLLGPLLEKALFAGDFAAWLDGSRGRAFGGWLMLLVPVAAALVALLSGRVVGPWFRRLSLAWSRERCARLDLARFVGGVLATLGLAAAIAFVLDSAGFDPRGSIVDTYVQRNALIVGFIMGFAIIPLIYTLAEDALNAVPSHLRLASLGAGATPWQTAVRVIVPTAASGLFSAVMVGLGRAVGETMIVLMAAGNTPVMDWNMFSGFRTLSANIAVELPEAVENSTHYRTLFLAALTLFAITFAVNTAAELVRQRFRKRAFQL
ncbi:MAG: ABC transporter permease subunit [Planctomycetota bacterium]|nr:ABC transporter permease subunit [Planctomycetota bacterium]